MFVDDWLGTVATLGDGGIWKKTYKRCDFSWP